MTGGENGKIINIKNCKITTLNVSSTALNSPNNYD